MATLQVVENKFLCYLKNKSHFLLGIPDSALHADAFRGRSAEPPRRKKKSCSCLCIATLASRH